MSGRCAADSGLALCLSSAHLVLTDRPPPSCLSAHVEIRPMDWSTRALGLPFAVVTG